MAQQVAYGSTLKIGAVGSSDSYSAPSAAVGEITSIAFSGVKQTAIEVTAISDAAKKFKAGIYDPGTIDIEVNMDADDAGQTILFTAVKDSALRSYLMTFGPPTGSASAISVGGVGVVTDLDVKAAVDGVVSASFKIKCSAAYTITNLT